MRADNFQERIWAEVDLDALDFNFSQIKKLLKAETKVLAIVIANAYGHGVLTCAKALLDAGADYLGVATVDEAMELRQARINAPILILGHIPACEAETVVANSITPTVYTVELAEALSRAAVSMHKTLPVHIKVNTGMERIGFDADATSDMIAVCKMPGLKAEGLFTHLACADEADSDVVHMQYQRFMDVAGKLSAAGIEIPIRHVLNSAGVFEFPQYQLEMVRVGIILYGHYSSDLIHKEKAELRPVMSIKGRVTHVHTVPAGSGVSYGWSYRAEHDLVAATVPIGYADGYNRHLSNCAHMLAGGKRVPIIGKICMDQCMIDVSSVHTITVGDEITIIGSDGESVITADELAALADTISYEILCAIGRRIPRVYLRGGGAIDVLRLC